MTTPTLELNIKASGVQEVKALKEALALLNGEVGKLAAFKNVSALDQLTKEMKGMRADMKSFMDDLKKTMSDGIKGTFKQAQQDAVQGGQDLKKAFDASMSNLVKSIDEGNQKVAKRAGELNTKMAADAAKSGEQVGANFAQGLEKSGAKVRLAYSVALGGGARAGLSSSGLGSLDVLMQEAKKIEASTPALEAAYAKAITLLERNVSAVMKAATQGPNTLRGEGYTSWWNRVLTDMEKGEAALAREYAKTIATLEKQTAAVMKAATQGPNTLRGSGYIAWWDRVINDMDAGEARVAAKQLEMNRRQVALASGMPAGPFSVSEGAGLGRIVGGAPAIPDPNRLNNISNALRQFTLTSNDAHGAARGLASGLGMLWLTWGQVLPLVAGAALSHAFAETVRQGAEVQNTFKAIEVLAEESAESVGKLEGKMLDLARNGPFGPQEIAKAMKTLALAGLDAEKVYAVTKDVLNFAIAGDTSIEKAADVLTTVATAFDYSAGGYSRISDVISVAAAQSKSSVESMASAFKQASVINTQYGVSLEDTAVGLSLLANSGIQSTNAGTSLRNMYADLAGRTPKVKQALKELGVEGIDPLTGKMRAQAEVFKDLLNALSQRTPTAQFNYTQAIFSERGQKEAMAILQAMRKEADETGAEVGTIYENLAKKVQESYGFTVIAAAQMALTPLNQMKSVGASLQATMVEVFKNLEGPIYEVTQRLKEAFGSDEFKAGLTTLIKLVGDLTLFLVEHARGLATVLLGYVAFKGVVTIITAVTLATKLWGEVTAAATTAVGFAGRAAAVANPLLTALAAIVTIAASAWAAYTLWADKGKAATENAATGAGAKALLDKLQEEETRLLNVAEARSKNISLMQLEGQIALEKARSEKTPDMMRAETELTAIESKLRQYQSNPYAGRGGGLDLEINKLLVERTAATGRLNLATEKHGADLLNIERAMGHIKELEEASAKAEEERRAKFKTPSGTLEAPGKLRNGIAPDSDMKAIEAQFRTEEGLYKRLYGDQMALLDNLHKNKLISEGEYEARSLLATEQYEAKQLKIIDDTGKKQLEEYRQRVAEARATVKPENVKQVLGNLKNEYITFNEKMAAEEATIKSNAAKRIQEEANNALGKIKELDKQSTEYWAKATDGANKEAALAKTRHDLATASDQVRAAFEAEVKVENSHGAEIRKLQEAYDDTLTSLEKFNTLFAEGPLTTTEQSAYDNLIAAVNAARVRLEKALSALEGLKDISVKTAVSEVDNKLFDEIRSTEKQVSKDMAKDLVDAVTGGGKTALRKLRDDIKQLFLSPIRIVLQAVIQPYANAIGGIALQALGLSGGGGSALGGLSALFGGGGSALTSGAGLSLAASNGAFTSAVGGGGAAAGAGMAGMAGLAGLIAVGAMIAAKAAQKVGIPPLVGAIAPDIAFSMLLAQKLGLVQAPGGPKVEGGSGTGGLKSFGDSKGAQEGAAAIAAAYKSYADIFGLKSLDVGFQFGKDPKGKALTQLDVTGGSYKRSSLYGGEWENVGRSDEDFKKAVDLATAQLIVKNLQEQVSGKLGDYLKGFNIATASLEDLQAGLKVASDVEQFTKAIQGMGPAFEHVRALSVENTAALLDSAGGVDSLTQKLGSFYANFFTAEDKHASLQTYLLEEFAKLNIALPKTREEYKKLVLAQDLTAQSGRDAFSALLGLSDAFAQLTENTNALTTATTTQADLDADVTTARALLQRAYDNEADRLSQLRDRMQSFTDKMGDFLKELTVGDLAGLTPLDQYNANKALFEKYSQDLSSSDPVVRDLALQNLEQAGRDFLESSRIVFAASDGYYGDLQQVVDAVTAAKELSAAGVDTANLQLTTLNNLVNGLVDTRVAIVSDLDRLYDVNGAGLLNLLNGSGLIHDGVLDLTSLTSTALTALITSMGLSNGGLVTLNGTTGSGLLAIVTAIQALQEALLNAAGGPAPSDDAIHSGITQLYQNDLGRTPDAGGLSFYTNLMKNNGYSLGDVDRLIKNSPEYLSHAGGISGAITSFYQHYLGRAPEAGGLAFYQGLYTSGVSVADIENMIKHSPEATTHNGGVPLRIGLDRVPYDGFPATLHQNESVLRADEAERRRNGTEVSDRVMRDLLERMTTLEGTLAGGVDRLVAAQFASTDHAAGKVVAAHYSAKQEEGWREHTRNGAKKK